MKTIELNDGEQQALLQLIDIAVKSAGLNVAEAAAVLAVKIGGKNQSGPEVVDSEPQFAEPETSIEPPTEEIQEINAEGDIE